MALAAVVLCACGGGAGSDSQYGFQTPVAGTTSTYSDQVVDQSNNTISLTVTHLIVSVAADGSFVEQVQTGGGIVDGMQYDSLYNDTYDSTGGLESEQDVVGNEGSQGWTYSPARVLLPYPLYVGKTWTASWTATSSGGQVNTGALTGGVVDDVEQVTVPVGTFQALRIQYQVVVNNPQTSITDTQQYTEWRDTRTNRLLKMQITHSLNAPPGTADGYPASELLELTSQSS